MEMSDAPVCLSLLTVLHYFFERNNKRKPEFNQESFYFVIVFKFICLMRFFDYHYDTGLLPEIPSKTK